MTKIKSKITKIIATVLGAFGIMSFTSCYGMPPGYYPDQDLEEVGISGTVMGDIDGDGKADSVPNIKVTIRKNKSYKPPIDNDNPNPDDGFFVDNVLTVQNASASSDTEAPRPLKETFTGENGEYDIYLRGYNMQGEYMLEFTDVDGEENGSFETETKTVLFDRPFYYGYSSKTINVGLKAKQKDNAENSAESEDNSEDKTDSETPSEDLENPSEDNTENTPGNGEGDTPETPPKEKPEDNTGDVPVAPPPKEKPKD